MSRFFSTAPFSSGVWPIAAIFASAMCAFLFMATPAKAATTEGAVISNGTVQLGVNAQGDLNYDCVGAGDTDCPDLSAGSGEQIVGLRYVPLNLDAISPAASARAGAWPRRQRADRLRKRVRGRLEHHHRQLQRDRDDVDIDGDDLRPLDSGLRDGDRAVLSPVTAQPQPLRGHRHRHEHWRQHAHRPPLSAGDGLGHRADGLRRMGDDSGDLTQLLFDSDDGFASSDPLSGPSYIDSESVCGDAYTGACQFTDLGSGGTYPTASGPDDHGALFDLDWVSLAWESHGPSMSITGPPTVRPPPQARCRPGAHRSTRSASPTARATRLRPVSMPAPTPGSSRASRPRSLSAS